MALLGKKNKTVPEDGQMELVEHLAELRSRILRAALYVVVSMAITWNFFGHIVQFLTAPIRPIMEAMNGGGISNTGFITRGIQDGFLLWMQVSFISGLILSIPAIVLELWGFIKPALSVEEQRPVKFLAPFSVLLFFAGIGTGYVALPSAFGWMSNYIIQINASLMQDQKEYILLAAKILLAFGLSFQLPVLLLFLGRVGILTASMMTTYWRHAVVVIASLAAIFTPSNDPPTMLMMAIPMAGFYLLSIGLVRAFEPKPDGSKRNPFFAVLVVALAPILIIAGVGYTLWRSSPSKFNLANVPTNPAPKLIPTDPDIKKRLELLEKEVAALREQVAATPTPSPTPAPLGTPEPAPTPDPATLEKTGAAAP
jgi:sec-independent protein translocase protein TatC